MTHLVNLGALLLALSLSLVAVAGFRQQEARAPGAAPEGGFRRIVSLGIVSDAALAELCEPQRVVAVSAWSTGPVARRWADKPRLRGLDDLEAIIALHPDLVLVSADDGGNDRILRLRHAALRVEALGPMRGLSPYTADLVRIGGLLGREDEARASGERLRARLARVADPAAPRPRAMYLATYGGTLFGGTAGTSYHDVLTAGGCADAAAGGFSDWPQYGVEQVVTLRPEVLVTKRGMAAELRALPGMAALRDVRYVEIDGDLLEDPGPRLLEAAEALRDALRQPVAGSERVPGAAAPAAPAGPGTATAR